MKIINKLIFVLVLTSAFTVSTVEGQKKKKKSKTESSAPKEKKKKSVSELVKSHSKIEGLFTFYQDSTSGKLKMFIKQDQLNKDFIHFYYVENGAVEVSAFRGQFRGSNIIRIKKFFDKIEISRQNTSFYFDPSSALSNAQDANISKGILYSSEIKAGSEKEGGYLIDADPIFLKDGLGIIDYTQFRQSPKSFKLGGLSKTKTKVRNINNYTENSDVIVEYVYENKRIERLDAESVTDARNISILVQHSLIQVPDNDYEIRYDDPRIGYFTDQVSDLTTTDLVNYKDLIHRWNLKKKDESAAISDPIEPITWWIENTTPVEFRETIAEGVLQWNKAFEKAGFSNAMVVKVQPDTATWDAGDIKYNVLRWTSSPNPPFGGYGPSFVNPRTGQILGADIMLEYVYHTNRVIYSKLYETTNLENNHLICSAGHNFQENTMLGLSMLSASGASDNEMEGLKKEAMLELIMHEVGHTLGLNHNMKASQLYSPAQLADKDFIKGKALAGSVMDYMAINLTLDSEKQGQYFSPTVGPYDLWAIEFGYTADASEANLNKILARSTEPALLFGNDADDMRSPGRGIDPRVMIGDLSNDQISYSIDRIKLSNNLFASLQEKFSTEGESYAELRVNFNILMRNQAIASNVISRFIGGVYVDRSMAGQEGAGKPFTPVSYEDQKRAMTALEKYTFAPDAFSAPEELYNYLARQRRGFNHYGKNEDPHIHDQVLKAQNNVLTQILHKNTLQRISDSELYGNKYVLSEYMINLNNAIFKADTYKNVNTKRQNLQIEYTKMLIDIIGEKSGYMNSTKSMALYNLKSIRKIAASTSGNVATKAHRQHLKLLIDDALES
ncbi:MAG: zinc-dependent metalloprotease [Reichenbachiella sp.]